MVTDSQLVVSMHRLRLRNDGEVAAAFCSALKNKFDAHYGFPNDIDEASKIVKETYDAAATKTIGSKNSGANLGYATRSSCKCKSYWTRPRSDTRMTQYSVN